MGIRLDKASDTFGLIWCLNNAAFKAVLLCSIFIGLRLVPFVCTPDCKSAPLLFLLLDEIGILQFKDSKGEDLGIDLGVSGRI